MKRTRLTKFRISRPDGRSNAQVLIDLVMRDKPEPGHVFDYDDLCAGLSWEGRTFTRRDVQQLVRSAAPMLSKQESRVLRNVPNVGYQVALANQHVSLALKRREKADAQMRRGLDILRNVKFEELNESERMAHEGHLLVTEALYQNQVALAKRQSKTEELIASLSRKVDGLSEGHAT